MALPVTRGSSVALYPFTKTISFDTGIGRFENAQEQRWAKRRGLVSFELNYRAFTQAQKNTFLAAFTSAKGQLDTTLSLTLGSTEYDNLSFDADELAWVESPTTQYSSRFKLIQSVSDSYTAGTSGGIFPHLGNGTLGILPYTQKKRFQTIRSRMEAGPIYTFAQFAGGLAGFPADGLMAWEFEENMLSDADLQLRISHFFANWGKLYSFPFGDEDGLSYAANYDMDDMVITYNGVNNSSVKIMLTTQGPSTGAVHHTRLSDIGHVTLGSIGHVTLGSI